MTLERPAYRFSVTNVDQGWTYSITQGDEPPSWDDVTVILADGLTMGWGFTNGQVPGPLDPDTCSFKLYVKSAEHLPAIETGDVITADLDRPGPGDTLIPYMHFAGRASDPELDMSPKDGIYLSIQATGLFDDFTTFLTWNDLVGPDPDGELVEILMSRALEDGTLNGVYVQNIARAINSHAFTVGDGFDLREFCSRIENQVGHGDDWFFALRSTYDWHPLAGPDDDNWTLSVLNDRPFAYYLEPAPLLLPPPSTLTEDDTDPDMVVLGPTEFADPGYWTPDVVTLDARHVTSPANLGKDRAGIVNTIDIGAVQITGTHKEVRKMFRDTASAGRYGIQARQVNTLASSASLTTLAAKFLNGSSDASQWSLPELTVTLANMDDDELDQLAPEFYPHAPATGYDKRLGRFFIVAGLPDRIAIGEPDLAAQLTGATFQISRGKLTITPRLRAIRQPEFATSITFDDLAASDLADTTFVDTGAGHFIDPTLDIDELAYTDI